MIIYRRLEYEGQYSDVETLISQKNSQPKSKFSHFKQTSLSV